MKKFKNYLLELEHLLLLEFMLWKFGTIYFMELWNFGTIERNYEHLVIMKYWNFGFYVIKNQLGVSKNTLNLINQ